MKMLYLVLLCLMFSGCAAKKLAIDNADTLVSHQITKRVPLYSKQKDKLSRDIDKFLNDSKPLAQEVIPIVDEINLSDEDKLDAQYEKFEDFYAKIAKDFSLLMSKHIATLDEKQQKDFFNTLDDENRELLKKEKEERLDHIEERFEMFFGSIKGEQKQLIREYADYFHQRARDRLNRRVKLHQDFREIFKQDSSQETRANMIQEAFVEFQNDTIKGNKNLEIIKKMRPTLTKTQKEHFRNQTLEVKELLKYFLSVDY